MVPEEMYVEVEDEGVECEGVECEEVKIQNIPKIFRTEAICLAAVRKDGDALRYVPGKYKTEEMCLAAVRQNGLALRFVLSGCMNHTMCLAAVTSVGMALRYVPDHLLVYDVCIMAITNDGMALAWVPSSLRSPKMCMIAVMNNEKVVRWLGYGWFGSYEREACEKCLEVARDGLKLRELIWGIPFNGPIWWFGGDDSWRVCTSLFAVRNNGMALQYVLGRDKSVEICFEAVKQNNHAMKYVPKKIYDEVLGLLEDWI